MESTKFKIQYIEICDISISLLDELTKSIERLDIDSVEGVLKYIKICIDIYKEEKNLYIEKLITSDLSPQKSSVQTVDKPHSISNNQ